MDSLGFSLGRVATRVLGMGLELSAGIVRSRNNTGVRILSGTNLGVAVLASCRFAMQFHLLSAFKFLVLQFARRPSMPSYGPRALKRTNKTLWVS